MQKRTTSEGLGSVVLGRSSTTALRPSLFLEQAGPSATSKAMVHMDISCESTLLHLYGRAPTCGRPAEPNQDRYCSQTERSVTYPPKQRNMFCLVGSLHKPRQKPEPIGLNRVESDLAPNSQCMWYLPAKHFHMVSSQVKFSVLDGHGRNKEP